MTWLFWVSYGALWLLAIVVAFALLIMLREHADVMVATTEGRSRLHGPAEGIVAPTLPSRHLAGGDVDVGRPMIVVFLSVTCQPCWERRTLISSFATDEGARINTVACCSGSADAVGEFASGLGDAVTVLLDEDGMTAVRWRVFMTPFAVGLDYEGRVIGKLGNPGYDNLLLLSRRFVADRSNGEDSA